MVPAATCLFRILSRGGGLDSRELAVHLTSTLCCELLLRGFAVRAEWTLKDKNQARQNRRGLRACRVCCFSRDEKRERCVLDRRPDAGRKHRSTAECSWISFICFEEQSERLLFKPRGLVLVAIRCEYVSIVNTIAMKCIVPARQTRKMQDGTPPWYVSYPLPSPPSPV